MKADRVNAVETNVCSTVVRGPIQERCAQALSAPMKD